MAGSNNNTKENKLWNRNFTILVVGSFISMAGYNLASFAMGLLVLDETESILRYALIMAASMVPRVLAPAVAGTYFDRHSRRKAIPFMDYCYAGVFILLALSLEVGFFSYWIYLVAGFMIGTIDGMYMVAFDSLFPILTTKKTSVKAYSVNSLLFPLAAAVGIPFSVLGYDGLGAVKLFYVASVLFAVTATIETRIIVREPHLIKYQPQKQDKLPPSPKELEYIAENKDMAELIGENRHTGFVKDFISGAKYIAKEKGLLAITLFFCVSSLSSSLYYTLMLPFFRLSTEPGLWGYLVLGGAIMIGRIVGANIHYHVSIPSNNKFKIAVGVYLTVNIISMIILHMPLWCMGVLGFMDGILSVTSYNIRISSTQHYVPDEKRGRFNGAFMVFTMLGQVVGQFIAGLVGESFSIPLTVTLAFAVNLLAVFIIVLPSRKSISLIYNQDL